MILDKIAEYKRQEVEQARSRRSLDSLKRGIADLEDQLVARNRFRVQSGLDGQTADEGLLIRSVNGNQRIQALTKMLPGLFMTAEF